MLQGEKILKWPLDEPSSDSLHHFKANVKSSLCLRHRRPNYTISSLPQLKENLVEWVRSGAPVDEEHAETNGFEDAGESADGDCVEGTLFGNDLRDNLFID